MTATSPKVSASILISIVKQAQLSTADSLARQQEFLQAQIKQRQLLEQSSRVNGQALQNIARFGVGGLGLGALLRGIAGLNSFGNTETKIEPGKTVEMPVMLPAEEETAKEKTATGPTDPTGLAWYWPAMLASGVGSTWMGWKGVDKILDKQRKKKTESDLEAAKAEFADAMRQSYSGVKVKRAVEGADAALESLYARFCKLAEDQGLWNSINSSISETFPNLKGRVGGAYGVYALATGGAGYALVNSLMQKNRKKKLLEKAIAERRRRQAMMRPDELYAVPLQDE